MAVSEIVSLRDRFLKVLSDAQAKYRNTDDWQNKEHEALLEAVNEELLVRGKETTTRHYLRRIEQSALGHVDYSSKFALYCAEFVLGNGGKK